MIRNSDNDTLGKFRRTSICKTSVLNLGRNPRVLGKDVDVVNAGATMPKLRHPRNFLPSHERVLSVLLKCIPLCAPEERNRSTVERRFRHAMERRDKEVGEVAICSTPLRWIEASLPRGYHVENVSALGGLFPSPGIQSQLSEFILMDVILNRKLVLPGVDNQQQSTAIEHDPDAIVMPPAYRPEDLNDESDYMYRTLIAYLPGAGVFYCARERRNASVGCDKALIQFDMSWLRLVEEDDDTCSSTERRLVFGAEGYVKCFAKQSIPSELPNTHDYTSAWRVSASNLGRDVRRKVYWASQCSDTDGPRMPPDYFGGTDFGNWPAADRGQEYNGQLVCAKSARLGGRHYATGCHHHQIPDDCLVIDGLDSQHADIIVDVAPIGTCKNRKSLVMVRNLDQERMLVRELRTITLHNKHLSSMAPVGTARASKGDVGTMHPIGTRVLLDGVTPSEYAANGKVHPRMFANFVYSLARVASFAFPDVLAVIQDTEADSGAQPCAAMSGEGPGHPGDGQGFRVGHSIDMSVDLANASHYDIHDASQGFSVWTEEMPGLATDWYFVMPNLWGVHNGKAFNGVAVKLRHGTAISWDGRLIRHCTSLSRPDGPGKDIITGGRGRSVNHLYGTFSSAKERIVQAGRAKAGLKTAVSGAAVEDDEGQLVPPAVDDVGQINAPTLHHVEEPPYSPTIKEADPDMWPPPKDGSDSDWVCFWHLIRDEKLRVKAQANKEVHYEYSIPRKKQRF